MRTIETSPTAMRCQSYGEDPSVRTATAAPTVTMTTRWPDMLQPSPHWGIIDRVTCTSSDYEIKCPIPINIA